jgi:hypothetical protein
VDEGKEANMAANGQQATGEFSEFDTHQLLLYAEGLEQHQELGRKGARSAAAAQIRPVFDSPTLQDAARRDDPELSSILSMVLNVATQREGWAARRDQFVGPERDAHRAEAERRAGAPVVP